MESTSASICYLLDVLAVMKNEIGKPSPNRERILRKHGCPGEEARVESRTSTVWFQHLVCWEIDSRLPMPAAQRSDPTVLSWSNTEIAQQVRAVCDTTPGKAAS